MEEIKSCGYERKCEQVVVVRDAVFVCTERFGCLCLG